MKNLILVLIFLATISPSCEAGKHHPKPESNQVICNFVKSITTSDELLFNSITDKDSLCLSLGLDRNKANNIEQVYFLLYSPWKIRHQDLLKKRQSFDCKKIKIFCMPGKHNLFKILISETDSLLIKTAKSNSEIIIENALPLKLTNTSGK